jgi:hypothetical protein
VPVVIVEGVAPVPPPTTKAFAASALDDAIVPLAVNANTPPDVPEVSPVPPEATGKVPVVKADVEEAYNAPPEVNDVNPVPPLVVASVPARVTAPDVAEFGVNPVVPALKVVTPSATLVAILVKSEPFQAIKALSPDTIVTPVEVPLVVVARTTTD